jgi:hypothetical protein
MSASVKTMSQQDVLEGKMVVEIADRRCAPRRVHHPAVLAQAGIEA